MRARTQALASFYEGDVWKAQRNAANATIIDNDNVLLLRPVHADSGFLVDPRERSASARSGAGLVIGTIYHIDPTSEKEAEFVAFFERTVTPLLALAGARVIASFVLERSVNSFPRLPVREGEHVFVWFCRVPGREAYGRVQRALAEMPAWRDTVEVELSARIREPQTLMLSPTTRSLL